MTQQTTQIEPVQITLTSPESSELEPAFEVVFNLVITATFEAIGEPARKALFNCLEQKFGIPQNRFSDDPACLAEALEQILGPTSSRLIEARIIQYLHRQVPDFKYVSVEGELFFSDYIDALIGFLHFTKNLIK